MNDLLVFFFFFEDQAVVALEVFHIIDKYLEIDSYILL